MKNKKGIMGSELATIIAIFVLAIILAVFFILTSIVFGSMTSNVIKDKGSLADDSLEMASLLKTPTIITLDGEETKVTISDLLTLFTMEKVSEDVVKEKIKEALSKSYGECYGIKFAYNGKFLYDNWDIGPSEYIISQRHPQLYEWNVAPAPVSTISMPSWEISFINYYTHYLILHPNDFEYCDGQCGVER